ncbi:MgtC/SapB family protein [Paenibacillus flagellatus]|uniref:Magnesium transporter MgtC n=1 Tax=Paenibacillus flagellatus TaxID=2211139 RepID=A0A2V5K3K8_9BACL|nr:MgtC/SapB family protein [Paenibacillus flagellatus]PYI52223.1 magnesium transporter MgtC [Paenibacillus flagellatus]
MIEQSVWQISHLDLTLRMVLAAVLGGLIGLEREWSNHAAGFRTHILVCIGSASIMLLSIYGFSEFAAEPNVRMDPARLAAQVISGIGFLGAGAIIRNGSSISGLTTAASVWVVAAIGLSVGAGFYYASVLATFLVLVSLFLLNKWEKHLLRHRRNQEIAIKIFDKPGSLGRIATKFGEQGIQIKNVVMQSVNDLSDGDTGAGGTMELRFTLRTANADKLLRAIDDILALPDVIGLESGSLPTVRMSALSGGKSAAGKG